MAQTIKLKRSNVAGNIPGSSDLALGEIAVNTADGALYIKKGDNTIVAVGDNDILHIDTSNGRVGVGTTSPSADLTVSGTIANDAFTIPNSIGTAGQVLKAPSSGTTLTWADESGSSGAIAPSINTMTGDGSTTTLTLSTTPVNENATIITFDGVLQHKSTYSLSGSTITFSTAPANGVAVECIVINTHSIQALEDGDSDTKIQVEETADEDKIRFDTAGTERMIIDASGNVGIGTTSPVQRLQVDGGNFYANGGSYFVNNNAGLIAVGDLKFTTYDGSSYNTTMYLKGSTGNVGIGTSSPNQLLEVKGTSGTAAARIHADTITSPRAELEFMRGTTDTFGGDTYTDWKIGTVGATQADFAIISSDTTRGSNERLTIEYDTGNVGIGTSSPSKKFVVSEGGAHGFEISPYDGSQNATRLINYNRNTDAFFPLEIEASQITFETGGSEKMRIDASGNLLVGTTSQISAGKLSISGGTSANGITATTDATLGYTAASFQRTASNGQLIQFKQGATEVGSIQSRNSLVSTIILDPRAGGVGLGATTNKFIPTDNAGTLSDGAIDLGGSANRFKDLYLSGNITVGGTVDGRDIATDGTKLDGIEASADVTDTTNVTAAGALMDTEVTNLAQVKAFDSSDYATAAQGTTADSALQNIVEDTTPQLGGDLASNGNDILFADNDKALFGAGSDLQIWHSSADNASYIRELGAGNLKILGDNVQIMNSAGIETQIFAVSDSGVVLYHNGVAKFETTSTGIDVTGNITVGNNDTIIAENNIRFKSSGAAYIDHNTVGQAINFRLSGSSSLDTTPLVVSSSGIDVTGNITVSGTVDGRDIATDGTKLDGIEANATADQTQSEINALGITATGLSGTPNITVGTISSGAITSTGNITLAEYLYHNGNTGTNLRFQTDRASLTSGGGAIVDAHSNGNLYLTGTTVQVYGNYNSSGTISSGAITSSGLLTLNDNYALINAGTTSNTTLEPVIWARSQIGASVVQMNVQGDEWQFGGGGTLDTTPILKLKYSTNAATFAGTISSGAITSTGAIQGASFSDGTISGITFIDEDSFATNSATRVPTQQSIKAYVDAQVAGVVDSAPAALNTLNELAAALGDDANFSTTTSTALGNRLRVDTASQGLTGTQQANAITNLGITATKAELNYVDGVTSNIQTQLDGKQASGSYLTGNQTITLSGDVSGSGTTSIAVTIADDSHNHVISNVDGLQTALDGKQTSSTFTSNAYLQNRVTTSQDTVGDGRGVTFNYSGTSGNKPTGTDHSLMTMAYSAAWQTQLAQDWRNGGRSYIRGQNNGTWSDWSQLWSSADFANNSSNWNTAYGWGDHASAGYLTGNQTITLSGDVSGSGTTSIAVTIADDSHNHVISNVDGLQTALDAKLASSSYTAADVLTKIKTVDGAGSGLDADLLDGISSASFLRSDTTDTASGNLTFTGLCTFDNDASPAVKIISDDFAEGLEIHRNHASNAPGFKFTNTSGQAGILYATQPDTTLRWRDGTSENTHKIWHEGNDGPGSGLDADTLDGQQGSYYAPASSALTTSTSFGGDVSGTYNAIVVADDSHNHVISNVDGLQTALDAKLASSSYTAADVLTKIKTVDGAGSGLDADLLDGVSSASFLRSDADDTYTGNLTVTGNINQTGALTATSKSFDIEHPTKEGMRLHHGVLEGPEHAVYIRGKSNSYIIELPDYWEGLVHEDTITVQLTPIGGQNDMWIENIEDNKVYINCEREMKQYFYFIQAERKDVERFEVEYGNNV